jgi:hypothetical protein
MNMGTFWLQPGQEYIQQAIEEMDNPVEADRALAGVIHDGACWKGENTMADRVMTAAWKLARQDGAEGGATSRSR